MKGLNEMLFILFFERNQFNFFIKLFISIDKLLSLYTSGCFSSVFWIELKKRYLQEINFK